MIKDNCLLLTEIRFIITFQNKIIIIFRIRSYVLLLRKIIYFQVILFYDKILFSKHFKHFRIGSPVVLRYLIHFILY
jgi:hypothetical protein